MGTAVTMLVTLEVTMIVTEQPVTLTQALVLAVVVATTAPVAMEEPAVVVPLALDPTRQTLGAHGPLLDPAVVM